MYSIPARGKAQRVHAIRCTRSLEVVGPSRRPPVHRASVLTLHPRSSRPTPACRRTNPDPHASAKTQTAYEMRGPMDEHTYACIYTCDARRGRSRSGPLGRTDAFSERPVRRVGCIPGRQAWTRAGARRNHEIGFGHVKVEFRSLEGRRIVLTICMCLAATLGALGGAPRRALTRRQYEGAGVELGGSWWVAVTSMWLLSSE